MKRIYIIVLIAILSSCSMQKSPRYQETSDLEKPPGVAAGEQKNSKDGTGPQSGSDHDTNKGLYTDVYIIDGQDREIIIERKVDDAWVLLGKAIRLNELKITGKNQKNGSYEVSYKSGGLLDGFSLFGNSKASTYLLKLDEHTNGTKFNISKVEDENDVDPGRLMDGAPDFSYDNSTKLRDLIFTTLQNDVPL